MGDLHKDWRYAEFVDDNTERVLGMAVWTPAESPNVVWQESADGMVRAVNREGLFSDVREYCVDHYTGTHVHLSTRRFRAGERTS